MRTKIFEATNGVQNWGKFLVGEFDSEWEYNSVVYREDMGVPDFRLLVNRGWRSYHRLVMDLQTGEGAIFPLGRGEAQKALNNRHQVWVCPLFEPFLVWLDEQPDLWEAPARIDLPGAGFALAGYRRGT